MIDARDYVTNPEGRYKVPWSEVVGIAIHHSVSGGQFFTAAVMTETDEINHIILIDYYHVSQGWGGFGYHLACFPSGRLYLCGDLDGARAHVASRNRKLRGIVFIGDFTTRDPGPAQLAAGAAAVAQVRQAAGRPLALAGHRAWALPEYPTSCPGDRLAARLAELEPHPEEEDEMKSFVADVGDGYRYVVRGDGTRILLGLRDANNQTTPAGSVRAGAALVAAGMELRQMAGADLYEIPSFEQMLNNEAR